MLVKPLGQNLQWKVAECCCLRDDGVTVLSEVVVDSARCDRLDDAELSVAVVAGADGIETTASEVYAGLTSGDDGTSEESGDWLSRVSCRSRILV